MDLKTTREKWEKGLKFVAELDTGDTLLVVLVNGALVYSCYRYFTPTDPSGEGPVTLRPLVEQGCVSISYDHRGVDAAQAFRWLALRASEEIWEEKKPLPAGFARYHAEVGKLASDLATLNDDIRNHLDFHNYGLANKSNGLSMVAAASLRLLWDEKEAANG